MTLTGIDLSHFNTTPDLTPYDFVFQKCTQGTDFLDPTYAPRHAQVRSLGKIFGAYHFMTTTVSVIDQVSWFKQNANIQPGDIVIVDFEDDGHWSQFTNEQIALKGITLLTDLDNNYPDNRHVLYCNQNTYNNIVHPFGVLGNDALWIADPSGTPSFPYTFWQYSSNGVDLDRTSAAFNTLQDLENWANMTDFDTQVTFTNAQGQQITVSPLWMLQNMYSWMFWGSATPPWTGAALTAQLAELQADITAIKAQLTQFKIDVPITIQGSGTITNG